MGVLLFILAWVVVGFSIFFIALRGGPRGVRSTLQTQNRGGRAVVLGLITVVYVAFGVAIPTLVLANDNDSRDNNLAGLKLTAAESHGRELFGHTCQQCHTLAASNAVGKVGPNLDLLRPPKALVQDAILNGRVRGNGTMPAGLLSGKDAQDVAAYVAKVAGHQ
jgi:cytochrome c551